MARNHLSKIVDLASICFRLSAVLQEEESDRSFCCADTACSPEELEIHRLTPKSVHSGVSIQRIVSPTNSPGWSHTSAGSSQPGLLLTRSDGMSKRTLFVIKSSGACS